MVWWLFKKKKEEGLTDINKNLRISFSNIKEDIHSISKWIKILDEKDKSLVEEVKLLKQEIASINHKINEINLSKEYEDNLEEEPITKENNKFDVALLTETQEMLLVKLFKLQKENNEASIPLKLLAKECYNRDYNKIRSTVSEYTGFLEELGMLERRKKGKQAIIELTQKGKNLAKKLAQTKAYLYIKKEATLQRKK